MKKGSILFSILLTLLPMGVSANSAQTYFQGVSSTGTFVSGAHSPLTIEQERLTFDLQEFPASNYTEAAPYLAYSGKVTAEYTIHNPSDATVTTTLAFPFGQTPSYGYDYDSETEKRIFGIDGEKYEIRLNGTPIESTLRHTLSYPGEKFVLEKDMSLLMQADTQDTFWQPDLPVTKYSWRIDAIEEDALSAARLGFCWAGDGTDRKLLLEEQSGGRYDTEECAIHRWVENGDIITLYVFGEPLTEELHWYTESGSANTPFSYTLSFLGTETMTYADFVFQNYAETDGILRKDWYYAFTQSLKDAESFCGILGNLLPNNTLTPQDMLRWKEYKITVGAGETVVNTITVPIYPAIDLNYDPPIYTYTYLLSPAQTWADFGTLDIAIHTPYFMIESGTQNFTQTETGYTLSLTGLPKEELTFTLSQAENPKMPAAELHQILHLITIGGGLLIGAVFLRIYHGKRKKKREQEKQTTTLQKKEK